MSNFPPPPPPPADDDQQQPLRFAGIPYGQRPPKGYQQIPMAPAGGFSTPPPAAPYQQAMPVQGQPQYQGYAPPQSNIAQSYQSQPPYSQQPPLQYQQGTGPSGSVSGRQQRVQGYAPLARLQTRLVKKEVVLTDGQFIVNIPLSKKYLEHCKYKDDDEFTHLRYTAATTDPNDFSTTYTLRQKRAGRRTRIAVVATMYNEDDVLFCKSMSAIMDNIAYLCSGNCLGWGPDSWKEVVVCIVSDGRAKVNQKTLDVLSVMGLYMDGVPRASVNGKPVTGHFFEFSTQVRVDKNLIARFADDPGKTQNIVPVQTIFLLKEKNAKKINSHRWFFKAVCDSLDPEICILIDIGTKPTKQSFFHLYRAFERDVNVAGACGEIAAELGPYWKNLLNPVVAVQNFEYKMSNILDKPLESVFGYISVLPGAFSAYRYKALQGKPLEMYFKGEKPHGTNVSEANMYLAEDRILCFELVMRPDSQNVLKYVKSAKAETDVPSELHDLIKQRRRWLNGSFFASVHAVINFARIWKSGHNQRRKILLFIETVYNSVNLLFSWFNIGNFYLSFYFLFNISESSSYAACTGGVVDQSGVDPFYPYGGSVSGVLRSIYFGSVLAMVIASMGNRPEASKLMYIGFAIIFAILMVFMIFMGIWTIKVNIQTYIASTDPGLINFFHYVFTESTFRDLVVSVCSTYLLYLISSVMFLDPWHVFTCMIQYLLMIPAFANILMVYAFCNIHDVSWGTKGITEASPLPAVTTGVNANGEKVATVELPDHNQDADEYFTNAMHRIDHEAAHLRDRKEDNSVKTDDDDFFKQFRTNTVLLWFFSNFLLVFIFTNGWVLQNITKAGSVNPYLSFLLWSVAILSFIRFLCSTIYIVGWMKEWTVDSHKRSIV
ncbi:Chitin synthase, class 2 [Entophlyctis sp. JEL0112]|nr:Chitin synthase, class 2 [Entophlyctis sp. JEL0112]